MEENRKITVDRGTWLEGAVLRQSLRACPPADDPAFAAMLRRIDAADRAAGGVRRPR